MNLTLELDTDYRQSYNKQFCIILLLDNFFLFFILNWMIIFSFTQNVTKKKNLITRFNNDNLKLWLNYCKAFDFLYMKIK